MTTKIKTRTAQYPLVAEFSFAVGDDMIDVNGVSKEFKDAAVVADIIPLPNGAVLIGGDMTVSEVSNDSGTATLKVGDSADDDRYLAATNIKALGRTPLVPTGYRGDGSDLRITLANQNGDATTGIVTIRAEYVIGDRTSENVI